MPIYDFIFLLKRDFLSFILGFFKKHSVIICMQNYFKYRHLLHNIKFLKQCNVAIVFKLALPLLVFYLWST